MSSEIQFLPTPEETPEFTAIITLRTEHLLDLGPVIDAVEAVVRCAPTVTGQVETASGLARTFYGWDRDDWTKGNRS